MVAKMAADFLENDCIHKISYHNMLLLGFWTQMIILEENGYK